MRDGWKLGDARLDDALILDGLWCAFEGCHMGAHADSTAVKYRISREDQDRFAAESQMRASRSCRTQEFADEIVPVPIKIKRESYQFIADESPRPDTNVEVLSKLPPVFSQGGTVTAGNASPLSDGAAALVVADRATADRTPAPWRAKIVAYHTSGVAPQDIFVAPVAAIRAVLDKAGLTQDDIDLYEINEAFASQMMACINELGLNPVNVNVGGGAIALGHPIGASGARVLVTLLAALKRRSLRRGLVSLCLGGGNAVAMIVDREV
jgi:acetyl-CoA C-acetyltransferase